VSGFAASFASLLRARFPYIYVGTWEEERVLGLIRETARNAELVRTPRNVFTWSITDGLVGPSAPPREQCEAPLDALSFVLRYGEPAVFVFKDFHVLFGNDKREQDQNVVRKLRDLSPLLRAAQKPKNVVFLSPTVKLPLELEKEITTLEFELPGAAGRPGGSRWTWAIRTWTTSRTRRSGSRCTRPRTRSRAPW